MPSTTRAAPAASAARTDASERSPPPYCTGTSSSRVIRSRWPRLRGLAGPRAVEVDHVQEARARLDERARRLERSVGVHGLVVEVPLPQAHRPAVANVHRGQQDHAATGTQLRTKFPSSLSPSGPDFSGWNCTPYSGGRATALTNSLP